MWAFLWIKLWQGLWWLYVPGTRGYYHFSRLMRFILPSQRKRLADRSFGVTPPITLTGIQEVVAQLEYKPDPLWGLFDYFRHPEAVWYRLTRNSSVGKGNFIGDCDDWAALIAWLVPERYQPTIMNVFYLGSSGRPGGHNVCVILGDDGTYWHMSNWRMEGVRGRPVKGFDKLGHVAKGIAGQGELVGWCLTTPDLKRIDWSFRGE